MAHRPIRRTMLSMELSGRIRLVLLDDHLLFRESLARLLAAEEQLELVAQCTTPAEALEIMKDSVVHVILVDIGMAAEFIPCVREARYSGKSLVIARSTDAPGSAIVLKSGASGIFLESDSSARLIQAIGMVANGEAWVDQKVIQLLADGCPSFDHGWVGSLLEREQTVLHGVIEGLSNRKIGDKIGVSESTIQAILQRLFSKTGVRTRTQLVRIALEASARSGSKAGIQAG